MRIFGRSRVTNTSAFRRTNAAASAAAVMVPVREVEESVVTDLAATDELPMLAVTDEMPIVRETASYPMLAASPSPVRSAHSPAAPDVVESTLNARGAAPGEDGDSDVFVCRRSSPDLGPEAAAAAAAAEMVTLFVYGWENVEPGPLSWAFPSLRAALDAVRTMRNAIEWCIVAGAEWTSIDAARAKGAVLVEQNI